MSSLWSSGGSIKTTRAVLRPNVGTGAGIGAGGCLGSFGGLRSANQKKSTAALPCNDVSYVTRTGSLALSLAAWHQLQGQLF